MNTSIPRSHAVCFNVLGLLLTLVTTTVVQGITLTDPPLVTGVNSIDPKGSMAITVLTSDSVAENKLESLGGFASVQSFTGFTPGTNTIAFTDSKRSDIQISFDGGIIKSTGGELNNLSYASSGTSSVRFASIAPAGARTMTQMIRFGSWDGSAFDGSTDAVSAVAFTLSGQAANFSRVDSITTEFLSAKGTVLSRQVVAGAPLVGKDQCIYFGYQSADSDLIAAVLVTVKINPGTSGEGQVILGLDDLGYTSTP
jgi:hypothetical protein